jgi:taurine dioxygenase
MYRPVTHPVVRVHPVTKKKAIYVTPTFTLHIKGMAEDESRMLLEYLYRRTLIHEYHYRHRWQPDMVVFWDNRGVQHSALHDYYPNRRLIERVTVRGDRPVGDAPPPDPSELRRSLMPSVTEFENVRRKRQHEL